MIGVSRWAFFRAITFIALGWVVSVVGRSLTSNPIEYVLFILALGWLGGVLVAGGLRR